MGEALKLNRRSILQSMATLFSGSIVAQGMTALALLLTARQLGVDGYGQYAACVALAGMTAIVFSLGLDLWLLREGGRSPGQLSKNAGSVLGIKAGLGVVWVLGFGLLSPILRQETYPVTLMRWSVMLIWSDTLLATTLTAFKAALKNRVPAALEASADILWCGVTVGLIGLGVSQPENYLMVRVLVSAAALLLGLGLLRRMVGLRFDAQVARQALHRAFPFAASEFLALVAMRADVVIIGFMLGKTATGLYSPAVGLINMAFLAPMAVYMVLVPVLSSLYQDHPQQARRTAKNAVILLFGLGMLLSVGIAVGAPLMTVLLGSAFQGSVEILRLLSLVLFFKCGTFALAAILMAVDQQGKRALVQGVAVAVNILGNLAVVNWLGIRGVAGMYVLTEIVLLIGYAWVVWRKNE